MTMRRSHRCDPTFPSLTPPSPPPYRTEHPQNSTQKFSGQGRTLGTKADDEEKKKARLAALEAEAARKNASASSRAGGGAASGAAAAAAARLAGGAGGSSTDDMRRQILAERERRREAMLKEKQEREAAMAVEDEDPAMAPLNDAVARVAAHATAEASAGLLLRIVGNVLTNPLEPKYRKVKLANAKVAGKFIFIFEVYFYIRMGN